jgi:hypothetical protein
MDKHLFAELLFNKTKVKALNQVAVKQVEALQPVVETTDVIPSILSELQSIFVECITNDDIIKRTPYEFVTFLKAELPSIISKFHKLHNGKSD